MRLVCHIKLIVKVWDDIANDSDNFNPVVVLDKSPRNFRVIQSELLYGNDN